MKQIRIAGLLVACLTLLAMGIMAQDGMKYFDIQLWEKGAPTSNGKEGQAPDEDKRIYTPMIRVFLPPKGTATGRAVITYPGGGYGMLAYNHEGYDFAPFFNNQGIALIVLKYRMPYGHREVPFSDAEEAMRLVKQHAAEWNIRPDDIGIMGSSAGGHLASTYATHSKPELRPAFQILLYPVITMDSTYTHMGSRKNLLGNNPSAELVKQYSNEQQVTNKTPRAFIVLSDDDKVVPPANGVNYYLALNKAGVPAALHIYPTGDHGWGINEDFKYKEEFLLELREWLRSF